MVANTTTGGMLATTTDLEQGWRTLSSGEREQAETLLARASRIIRATCPNWQRYDERAPDIAADICCAMVKRAMSADLADLAPAGVTQVSSTSGPFSNSYTLSNPLGDLYMLASEKRLLGAGMTRAFTITYKAGDCE
ncbi:Gp19/Gp15/Gp42 family protein [Bifidobacterium sp.]|uniref:Gp19/Gp15/Gp42 family protein n=1 Tax=Bifidobacterium sp. TaxID=41200 RepID=UPI0039E833AA